MAQCLSTAQFDAAIAVAESDANTAQEKTEMLMKIAMGMQSKPKSAEQLHQAVAPYERALAACPGDALVLQARVRMGTALQALPDGGTASLYKAQACYEAALPILSSNGRPEYAASGHPLENNLRALAAYDEALKVRNENDTPFEYANTLSNMANLLRNLPEDPLAAGSGRSGSLQRAQDTYREAMRIFRRVGQSGNASLVEEALTEVEKELAEFSHLARHSNGNDSGTGNGIAPAF